MSEYIEGLKLTKAEWEAIVLSLKYTPYGRFEELPEVLRVLTERARDYEEMVVGEGFGA